MASLNFVSRVERLEKAHHNTYKHAIDEPMRRARKHVEKGNIFSSIWKFVPPNYYDLSLEQRSQFLGSPSIHHLCKSLLMENKKCSTDDNDPQNPRHVLVVIQYSATLDVQKLTNAVRALRPPMQRLDESHYNLQLASEEDNTRITGYQHNSVTPFGLLQDVPIILSEDVMPLRFIWMGGGALDLKLGCSTTEFIRALSPTVCSISRPRTNFSSAEEIEVL
jgi:prolyl-tRNA editing enzyme YbaK/EbsC (Cys-tRNA(Pro) deacylase)